MSLINEQNVLSVWFAWHDGCAFRCRARISDRPAVCAGAVCTQISPTAQSSPGLCVGIRRYVVQALTFGNPLFSLRTPLMGRSCAEPTLSRLAALLTEPARARRWPTTVPVGPCQRPRQTFAARTAALAAHSQALDFVGILQPCQETLDQLLLVLGLWRPFSFAREPPQKRPRPAPLLPPIHLFLYQLSELLTEILFPLVGPW